MNKGEWYVGWFDSPYYHLLYNNRNFDEANFFINNLCEKLQLQPHSKLWDLACGKGRHSLALNKKGFDVVGTDLSPNNIKEASKNSNDQLDFYVHDMREPFRINYFNAVLNLFTSIGYFENMRDNFSVFKNVANALRPDGVFVIDFLNAEKIPGSLDATYNEQRGDQQFQIHKKVANNTIHKRIEFNSEGKDYYFEESVSLLRKADFQKFADAAGLKLDQTFGNYSLEAFDEKLSDRLILIFKK
jgi:SAM-dependent methyltransferase